MMLIPEKPKPSKTVLDLEARAKATGVSEEIISIWARGRLDTRVLRELVEQIETAKEKPRYVVRENAGYNGEREVHETTTASAAYKWIKSTYDADELESLNVAVYDRKIKEYV